MQFCSTMSDTAIDLDNRQPPLLIQIDSYLLHIEAGLL